MAASMIERQRRTYRVAARINPSRHIEERIP
jgi:hypothetical protein